MSDTITIANFDASVRVPGVFAIIDASMANTALPNQRTLIVGQMTTGAPAVAGHAVISAGVADAQKQYGVGSQLAIAVERYRLIDPAGEVWCLPLADPITGGKASATVSVNGAATAPGTIFLYLDGTRVAVPVAIGDDGAIVAEAIAAAIGRVTTRGGNLLWESATASGPIATVNVRNGGTIGNQAKLGLSLGGPIAGEGPVGQADVPGLSVTITPFTNGTGAIDLPSALAGVPAQSFDFIALPYSDPSSIGAMRGFLADVGGTWDWTKGLFGGAFVGFGGTFAERATWANANNDQHLTAIGAHGSPSPDWHWGIDYCAAAAVSLRANPSLPVGGLTGGVALRVMGSPLEDQDAFDEQNTLLYDGMSTHVVDPSGVVRVSRAITTYHVDGAGAPDDSYLDLEVPYQLAAYVRGWRTMISSRFNRSILVDDGNRIPPGSALVSPSTLLLATISNYRAQAAGGLVQNPDQFAKVAAASISGKGTVAMRLPVMLGGQLVTVAAQVQFVQPGA